MKKYNFLDNLDNLVSGSAPNIEELKVEYAKQVLYDAVKELREKFETGGFPFNGFIFETDRDSILRIASASQSATTSLFLQIPFSTTWSCKNNEQFPVPDSQTMLQIQAAFTQHGQNCHLRSRALKEQILEAETIEELKLVYADFENGWFGENE